GFLLTAVPNWTGRLPVTGAPLLGLLLVWVAGRGAVLISGWIGAPLAAIMDLAFLACLGAVVARGLSAGKNRRSLTVRGCVGLLLAGAAVGHAEIVFGTAQGFGAGIGSAATVLLISLIGGRIIPSFTRNWVVRQGPGRLPEPFARFD